MSESLRAGQKWIDNDTRVTSREVVITHVGVARVSYRRSGKLYSSQTRRFLRGFTLAAPRPEGDRGSEG